MINNEKLLSMYENLFESERDSLKTVDDAKCLYDFEQADSELYRFVIEIGSLRYKLFQYLKSRGLK